MSLSSERITTISTSFCKGELFRPDPSNLGGGNTTYFEVTGGVTIKPPLPKPFAGLLIRPEVRYDASLNNIHAIQSEHQPDQWTLGLDAVLEF